jgi:hypothetical protein
LIQILRINAPPPVIAAVAARKAARVNATGTGANGLKSQPAPRATPSGREKIRIR